MLSFKDFMVVDYLPGMPDLVSYQAHKRHRGRIGESVDLEENKIFFVKVGDGRDSMTVKTKAANKSDALKKLRSQYPKDKISLDRNQKQGEPAGTFESVELEESRLKVGDKVETPQGTVEIKKRDTRGMRGKQDDYAMVLHMKNGKKASMGSHPAPTASAVTNIAKSFKDGVPSYMAHLKVESVEEASAQSRLDRRAAKHGLGKKSDRLKKATDFFSKPPPSYSKDELRKMGHPVEDVSFSTAVKKKPVSQMTPAEKEKDAKRRKAYKDFQKGMRKGFKSLRASCKNEDVNELSRGTMSRYAKKASADAQDERDYAQHNTKHAQNAPSQTVKNARLRSAQRANAKADQRSKGVALAKKKLGESKSASGYDLYHKTFSGAMQHAYAWAKKQGVTVSDDDIDNKVATGPAKPKSGKTNSYILSTDKKNRRLHVQVANLDNRRYELNAYIQ